MKPNTIIPIIVLAAALGGLLYWAGQTSGPQSTGDIIVRNGMHWHPTLTIYVDEVKQSLPENIGLIGKHSPIHTHDEDAGEGVIHLEFGGIVRADDIRLKNFFSVWGGKDIKTAFGTLERMTVNGEENTEYGEHMFGEHDAIELFYTTQNADSATKAVE